MIAKYLVLCAVSGLAVGLTAIDAEQTRGEVQSIRALIEPIRLAHHLPAMGAAIVTSRGLAAMGVTGVRKAGTDVAPTDADLWHLGSDTKAMTSVMIGALIERGTLKWDATIGGVFPVLAAGMPPAFRRITLLELLSHRAGLPANIDWQQAARSAPSPREQRVAAVKAAAATPLRSAPGSKYEYSNLGYVIAGAMAEQVSDASWEDLMRDIVFSPLGMTGAGFGGTGTRGQIDQPWPHGANGRPMPQNGSDVDNPEVMGPAGTVHAPLSDWAKFIADQLRGLRHERALLKPESYETLHAAPFNGDYAFGWLVTERPWAGGVAYTHAGSNTMNYAVVWMAPARDFAVLIVTNQAGPEAEKACDDGAAALIQMHAAGR